MKAIVGILALLGVVQSAVAGGTYTGVFKLDYYGSLYIDASATQMADRPACATRTYVHLQEAESDPVFKNKFAMILAAWLADKPLTMVGTGACTSEGDEIISIVVAAGSYPLGPVSRRPVPSDRAREPLPLNGFP